MAKTIKNYFPFISIALLLIFFGIISYNFPLTGDDLNWGVVKLNHYFSNGQFNNYDGRYLGNTLIIIASKSPIIRITLYASSSTLLLFLAATLINKHKWVTFIWPMFILCITISLPIFNQTWGWNSGFFNYVVGLIYPLYFANILKYHVLKERHIPSFNYIIIVIGSILSCFFVEHVTLLNLSVAIFTTYYVLKNSGFHRKLALTNLFGTLLGTILMFSNKSYLTILKGHDSYQYRSTGTSIKSIYTVISTKMDFYLLINNIVLTTLLTILLIYILIHRISIANTFLTQFTSFIALGFVTCFWAYHYLLFNTFLSSFNHRFFISFILTMIYYAIIIFESFQLYSNHQNHFTLLYCLLTCIILIAPFAIVTPFGPRGAFGSAFFLSILILTSYDLAITHLYDLLKPLTIIVSLLLIVFYGEIAFRIGEANRTKTQFISYQKKQPSKKVLYLQVPYSLYYWSVYKQEDNPSYRRFYKIPQTAGELVPYREWRTIVKNSSDSEVAFDRLSKKYLSK